MVEWSTLQEVGVPIAAGIMGYCYHAFRNRVRPFISIKHIAGDIRRFDQQIDVPEAIIARLKACIHLPSSLSPKESIRQLVHLQNRVNVLHDLGENLVRQIGDLELALERDDRVSFLNKVDEILTKKLLGEFIISMSFVEELVPRTGDDSAQEPLIEYSYNDEDHGGCFWVAVPGKNTWQFGETLKNYSITKARLENLLRAIRSFNASMIKPFLARLKSRIDAEARVASAIQADLSKLLDVHSRWEILLHVANLGEYPFLISSTSNCEVRDGKTRSANNETAALVLIKRSEAGDIIRSDALHPFVIAPGTSCEISFVTTNTQREMQRGASLRELFESRSGAVCRVSFSIEKPGIFRTKTIRTSWVPFSDVAK